MSGMPREEEFLIFLASFSKVDHVCSMNVNYDKIWVLVFV